MLFIALDLESAHDNQNLKITMKSLSELVLNINAKKARVGLRKLEYLGFTLSQSSYSLEIYIQEQSVNTLLSVSLQKSLKKMMAVLNICRSVFTGFRARDQ